MMIGRRLDGNSKSAMGELGDIALEVKDLSCGSRFKNINFTLRKGEVLGMYGLVGAGRTEIAETLFGIGPQTSGQIFLDSELVTINSPADAVNNGIALVPENRKEQGLVLGMNCRDNITMSILNRLDHMGVLRQKDELAIYNKYESELAIKTPSWAQKVGNLSGRNQQKVVIGKWLATNPKVLILDEPTRGIDVGSKSEIHKLIRKLAQEGGYAILVISSEMPEVLGVSDRILALFDGKINGEFTDQEVTEDKLVKAISFDNSIVKKTDN